MATVCIENVPDELYERLRARAKERGISISKLVIELVERALIEQELAKSGFHHA